MTFDTLLTRGHTLLADDPEAGRSLRAGVRADDLADAHDHHHHH